MPDPKDVREEYVDLTNRARSLEPTGDPEHDRLNQESHGLDALAPERNQVFADADADALDDEEHSD